MAMTLRCPLPLLLSALVLAGCNGDAGNIAQTNTSSDATATETANSAQPAPAPSAACGFSGWSSDPDPRGLNVRAEPSANARVLGTLPPPEDHPDNETAFGATFDVLESRDGWFRIRNARRWSQEGRDPSTLPSGWISGRYLAFQLLTDKVFEAPDPASRLVLTSEMVEGTLTQFRYRRPTECRGEWVRLTVTGQDGRDRQGWVRGIGGIQETTCDGVEGDLLEESENRGWTGMD